MKQVKNKLYRLVAFFPLWVGLNDYLRVYLKSAILPSNSLKGEPPYLGLSALVSPFVSSRLTREGDGRGKRTGIIVKIILCLSKHPDSHSGLCVWEGGAEAESWRWDEQFALHHMKHKKIWIALALYAGLLIGFISLVFYVNSLLNGCTGF